jgi:hypothetical protein
MTDYDDTQESHVAGGHQVLEALEQAFGVGRVDDGHELLGVSIDGQELGRPYVLAGRGNKDSAR